jgi:hypothetical protein
MQVPLIAIAVIVEVYVVLLIATLALFLHSRKQKNLLRRQQEKLIAFIDEINKGVPAQTLPEKNYRQHINEQIDLTEEYFYEKNPDEDITECLTSRNPAEQRTIALRYAFLRAEELSTIEQENSPAYWALFLQSLEPLLPSGDNEEIETYKKRISNLEKFKKMFFDLEKQWNQAQSNAQNYYEQLSDYAEQLQDKTQFTELLDNYHQSYDGIKNTITTLNDNSPAHKTINIIRQDPRAAEEIMKLRNVAADQHRIINNLQKQLTSAVTLEDKNTLIKELEKQLERQVRFVQESDTCVQLLEEELERAHQQLEQQAPDQELIEENTRIKETLHNFSLESKDLVIDIDTLEEENLKLKEGLKQPLPTAHAPSHSDEFLQAKGELAELQNQYAELEEKYLELKMK